jgi:hypothetical protein
MTRGVVAALSSTTKVLEIVIIVVILVLLVMVVVLYTRRNRPAKAKSSPTPQNYYGDLATVQAPQAPTNQGFGQPADPFAGFGSGAAPAPPAQAPQPMAAPAMAAPAMAAPAPPPAPAAPAGPVPGTPAGWLPDPSGAPNTLRYWDGNAWTQHVATKP